MQGLVGVLYIKMQFLPLSYHLCKGRWNIQCREKELLNWWVFRAFLLLSEQINCKKNKYIYLNLANLI